MNTVAAWSAGGFSFAFGLVVFRSIAALLFGRLATKEAQLDAGTQLLIQQQQTQIKELIAHNEIVDRKLAECLERDIEKERRIAHLEGINQGRGDARNDAAAIVARDRVADRRKPRDKE